VAAYHRHRWILTSLLTFVGLVLALLMTHSQLHWLHTVADSWSERKFRKQRLYCLPEKKRERQAAFSYLHSSVYILLSYIHMSKDLQVWQQSDSNGSDLRSRQTEFESWLKHRLSSQHFLYFPQSLQTNASNMRLITLRQLQMSLLSYSQQVIVYSLCCHDGLARYLTARERRNKQTHSNARCMTVCTVPLYCSNTNVQ